MLEPRAGEGEWSRGEEKKVILPPILETRKGWRKERNRYCYLLC